MLSVSKHPGFFTWIMEMILPERLRREVFIITLTRSIIPVADSEINTVQRIKELFDLNSQPAVLVTPFRVGNRVWGKDFARQLSECIHTDSHLLATRIYEVTPQWLKYSDQKKMIADIELIIKNKSAMEVQQ